MGYLSLLTGALAAAAVAWPVQGKYAAVGLGLFALIAGLYGAKRARGQARRRLAGAAGVTLGVIALLLGGAKIVLTLLAIHRLEGLLGT